MDDKDYQILFALQKNANTTFSELAEKIGLSAPAIHERVKKLKRKNIIKENTIRVDSQQLGFGLAAFVLIKVPGTLCVNVAEYLEGIKAVENVSSISGDYCLSAKIRVRNTDEIENLLLQIKNQFEQLETHTIIELKDYFNRQRID